jgi:hypothetical protein
MEREETRAQQDARECYDAKSGEFDWDKYQELCDIADYWDMEE